MSKMTNAPTLLTVTTLGRFAVYRGEQQLSGGNWKRRKVNALFKLLISADQHRLHREQIQEILWPSSTSEQAANSFGTTLYLLRRALEPERTIGKDTLSTYISLNHDMTLLVPENIQIDVDLFESRIKELQVRLAQERSSEDSQLLSKFDGVLQLYTGDYLPEELYEDWTQKRRERLRRLHCWLLEHAAHLAIAQRMGLRAREYLQTLLEHDPTDEQTHRLLMLVSARMGHRTDALNQFNQLRTILRSELNTAPLPETVALCRDIQNGRIPCDLALSHSMFDPVPSSSPTSRGFQESISIPMQTAPEEIDQIKRKRDSRPTTSTASMANRIAREEPSPEQEDVFSITALPSLVGREDEMQRLQSLYEQSHQEQQHICFISGEPGIGKTRLASEFASWAQATHQAQVLWGHCYEMSTALPYQPLVDVLETHARSCTTQQLSQILGNHGADLARIVSEIRAKLPDLPSPEQRDPEAERYNLYSSVAHYLRVLVAQHPLIIILDDVQWADVATFQLLSYLTSRAYDQSRDASAVPFYILLYRADEIHEKHPLRELLATFSRMNNLQDIHLKRLDEKAVQQLVANSTRYSFPDAAFTSQIYKHTEGNPFFVGQILLSLIQEGKVQKSGEHWQISVDLDKLTLPQSVHMLIERRLLRLSPACRTTLMTAAILGRQLSSVLLCKACNLSEELIAQHVDDAIQLHILMPLPEPTTGQQQSTLSRYPVDLTFTHDKIREVLYQGLNPLRRRTLHRQAAQAIEALYSPHLPPYYSVLALHYQMAEEYKQAIDYHLKASHQAFSVYAFHDAANHMENVLALLIEKDEQPQRAEVLHQLSSEAYIYLGLTDKSIEAGQTASALWHDLDNPVKEAEAHLDVAFAFHWQGEETKSLTSIQQALECLEHHQNETLLLAKAHTQWGMSAVVLGDTSTALDHLQRAEELHAQIGGNDPFVDVVTLWSRSWYAFLAGTAHEMLTYAQRGAEACRLRHRPGWEPMLTYPAAWALMLQGNIVEGERIAQEALAKAQRNNAVGAQAWAFLVQTFLAIQSAQWQCAQQCSDNALTIARMLRDLDLQARILWSRSILSGWLNDWQQSICEITEALQLAQQLDSPSMVYPHLLIQAAKAHLYANHLDEAQRYLDQGMHLAAELRYRQVPALAKRLQGRILFVQGAPHQAQMYFEQSLSELEALEDRVEYARTLEAYGQCSLADPSQDEQERGQALLASAQEIFQQLGLKG
jgi:DNA-binding SARP family transcriptional activator